MSSQQTQQDESSELSSEQDTQQLFETIGPLPLRGRSWPKPIAVMAWILIALIGTRLGFLASTQAGLSTPIMASVMLAYTGMVVVAFFMWTGHTTITEEGIKQEWILRREMPWSELKYAKFIPLFYSKRLLCFTKNGRPVVFQGASEELQIAFAHISLTYKRAI